MNKRCVIISGGTIEDSFALQILNDVKPQTVIGVDGGLSFLYRNDIMPTHIVGDFDSADKEVVAYYRNQRGIDIREFNPVKDATDTEIAVRLALELGVKEIVLLGATGTRLDHVMANIQILKIALEQGVQAYIQDGTNRISLWEKEIRLSKENGFGTYFSLFPLGGTVEGLYILGAKYPLSNYTMNPYESRTVSNEYEAKEVLITFSSGIVVLMETRDK